MPDDIEEDPFLDQIQPLLIGQSQINLDSLAYLFDNPVNASIIGTTANIIGKLEMNIIPVDQDGESEINEDLLPDEPSELVGQRIDFIV